MKERPLLSCIKNVKVTNHACERFWEYRREMEDTSSWPVREIRKLIAQKLREQQRLGLPIDKTGATHIPIGDGLHAVLILDKRGIFCGFVVVTIHKNEREIDINELRRGEICRTGNQK